jgi:hypothetical protein
MAGKRREFGAAFKAKVALAVTQDSRSRSGLVEGGQVTTPNTRPGYLARSPVSILRATQPIGRLPGRWFRRLSPAT